MTKIRQQGEEGTSFEVKRSKRSSPSSFRSVVMDVMKLQRQQNLVLEPLLRRVVKEEVDSALRNYTERNSRKDILPFGSRSLQLQFSNDVSLPVFTRTRIQGEGCTAIGVSLVDVANGHVVSSGPGSSAKVEIVVLGGDFGGDHEGENWTLEEFTGKIVRGRIDKKPLLAGDVILALKDGKGVMGAIEFTDNSSWTRSRKFRLGARLTDDDDIDGVRVREARSEPFVVRNHLREAHKKHHPPSLSDEVWRLDNIRKDGAFHKSLSAERINTVKDLRILLSLDPERLRKILGTGMSPKKWEVTVNHARTCVLDRTLYSYDGSTSPQRNGVVFNVVAEVMGMFRDGQYVTTDKLSEAEKNGHDIAMDLKQQPLFQHPRPFLQTMITSLRSILTIYFLQAHAYKLVIFAQENHDKIHTLDDESSLHVPSSLRPSNTDHQDIRSHNAPRSSSLDFLPSICSIGGSSSFDYFLRDSDPKDISYDQSWRCLNEVSDTLFYDTGSISEPLCANEHWNYFDMDNDVNAFTPSSVPIDKASRWWPILLSVLRWRFSIKKIVARKNRVCNTTRR